MIKNFKLSPSSLSLYDKCERCFWLTQHKIWSRPSGIFPSLPNGMDKVFKIHFNKFRDKGELPPEIRDNELCKEMKLFEDEEQLKIWQNALSAGVSYTNEDGDTLRGGVDNILVNTKNGKLIVLDYKTRGYPLTDIEKAKSYYIDQLTIYTYLLRKNNYKTEDYAFLLFYYPKEILVTGEIIFDTKLVKIELEYSLPLIKDNWKEAIDLLNKKCPKQTCDFCQVVKNPRTYLKKKAKESVKLVHPNQPSPEIVIDISGVEQK